MLVPKEMKTAFGWELGDPPVLEMPMWCALPKFLSQCDVNQGT
jgi:hypothetical protein